MTKSVSIRLDEETLLQLDIMAAATDRSRAWLMAHAVQQYIEHESWQIDAIKKALDKIEQGKAKFASHQEVKNWVKGWDGAAAQKLPKCK